MVSMLYFWKCKTTIAACSFSNSGPGECCSFCSLCCCGQYQVLYLNYKVCGYFEVLPYQYTLSSLAFGLYPHKLPPQKVLYLAYKSSNHTLYITLKLPYTKQHVNPLKFTSNMLRLVAGNKQHPWNDFVACNKLLRVWLPLSFMQL